MFEQMIEALVISSEASHIYIILFFKLVFNIVNGACNGFGACRTSDE